MIHLIVPVLSTLSKTAEPSGGRHGTWYQLDSKGSRGLGFASAPYPLGGCFPQLPHYPAVGLAGYHRVDRPAPALFYRHRDSGPASVSYGRDRSLAPDQAAGAQESGHARVLGQDEAGRRDQPAGPGLRLFHVVGDSAGGAPGQGDRHLLRRRPDATAAASRRLFLSSSQAHHEGQARRGGLRKGPPATGPSKKTPESQMLAKP
jgi:hypothetical protein